jgi:hypothetical protein
MAPYTRRIEISIRHEVYVRRVDVTGLDQGHGRAGYDETDAVCDLCEPSDASSARNLLLCPGCLHNHAELKSSSVLQLGGGKSLCRREPHRVERAYLHRPDRFHRLRLGGSLLVGTKEKGKLAMERMKKTTDRPLPFAIHCGGCQQTLETAKYQRFPPHDTPKERIHNIIDPTSPSFSVGCTSCGHYTQSMPASW